MGRIKSKDQIVIDKLEELAEKKIDRIINKQFLVNNLYKSCFVLDNNSRVISLRMDSCGLIEIPEIINNLESLRCLELSNNRIRKIENLDRLKNLKALSLFGNLITKIENLNELFWLENLNLGDNEIEKMENLDSLTNLLVLNLRFTNIKKIENVDNLKRLKSLNLENNAIEKIENLNQLNILEELNLSANILKKIENLDMLSGLTSLFLAGNDITKIENLDKLSFLKTLDLRINSISKIENLNKLKGLSILNLGDNHISEIENLDTLIANNEHLLVYLEQNKILDASGLRGLLEANENLKIVYDYEDGIFLNDSFNKIFLGDNYIQNLPVRIIKQGRDAILRYFKTFNVAHERLDIIKIVVIGNTRVGKSTLVDCYKDGIKNGYKEGRKTTEGMKIVDCEKEIEFKYENGSKEKRKVVVSWWDFGGQEYYHGTYNLFLDSHIAVLVATSEKIRKSGESRSVDISNRSDGTIEQRPMDFFPANYWLKIIKNELGRNVDLLVIQNQCDKYAGNLEVGNLNKHYLSLNSLYISKLSERELSTKYTLTEKQVRDIRLNCENMYENSWKEINNQLENFIRNNNYEVATSYKIFLNVLSLFEGQKSEILFNLYLKWKKLLKNSEKYNNKNLDFDDVKNKEIFCDIIRTYKSTGRIIYFFKGNKDDKIDPKTFVDENKKLKIYLDSKYITDTIYQILNREKLYINRNNDDERGRFTRKEAEDNIKDLESRKDLDFFLDLMEEKKIIFQDNNTYVAPQYLPEIGEKYKNSLDNIKSESFSLGLYFPILPRYMMVQLISSFGRKGRFHKDGVICFTYFGFEIAIEKEDSEVDVIEGNEIEAKLQIHIKEGLVTEKQEKAIDCLLNILTEILKIKKGYMVFYNWEDRYEKFDYGIIGILNNAKKELTIDGKNGKRAFCLFNFGNFAGRDINQHE